SSVIDTMLLYVVLFDRCRRITSARRGGGGPPSSKACSSDLPGSANSIDANRQPSPTPCSRIRIDRPELVLVKRIQWVRHGITQSHPRQAAQPIRRRRQPVASENPSHACLRSACGSYSTRGRRSNTITARSALVYAGQPSPGTPVRENARQRDCTSSLTRNAERLSTAAVSSLPNLVRYTSNTANSSVACVAPRPDQRSVRGA